MSDPFGRRGAGTATLEGPERGEIREDTIVHRWEAPAGASVPLSLGLSAGWELVLTVVGRKGASWKAHPFNVSWGRAPRYGPIEVPPDLRAWLCACVAEARARAEDTGRRIPLHALARSGSDRIGP